MTDRPLIISQATIDEIARVAREWPDGIHTCAELQVTEPRRRPCTCGRCPADAELFARTAPQWNCVDYPAEGMHYTPGLGGCAWCGMTTAQIAAEQAVRDGC